MIKLKNIINENKTNTDVPFTIRCERIGYYHKCPHCKKEIFEKHTYFENDVEYHSDCHKPIKWYKTKEDIKETEEFLKMLGM